MSAPSDKPASTEAALSALSELAPRLTVELHASGRMRAPQPGARELLQDRLRNAELLPCGPGWLVMRSRDGEGTAPVDARRVVAAGVLGDDGLSLIDFVGFLETTDESGLLAVAHGDVERSLFFKGGSVVWAASTNPQDHLGELLVRRGRMTREQLTALQQDPESRGRIGGASVTRGFVTSEAMGEIMRAQLVEIFDRILAMNEGIWSFARVPDEVVDGAPVQISAQSMLMDALRRIDEMQVYRQRVRSDQVRVRRVGHVAGPRGGDGPSTVDLVLRLDDGVRELASRILDALPLPATIQELMLPVGESEYAVTRAVYQLLRSNLVEVVEDAASQSAAAPTARPDQAKAIIHVYSMAIREVFDDVASLGQCNQLRAAARAYLADEAGEGTYAELLRNVVILPDGTLEEESALRGVVRSRVNAAALNDGLSELLFFVLFQATELLGRRRGDDLARRVKMIHAMLSVQAAEVGPS